MLQARDIMTRDVVTVRAETPVTEIARLMAENEVSGLPVVDNSDCLVGIVTEEDLLLKHSESKIPHRLALFGLWVVPEETLANAYSKARVSLTAGDIMTRKVVTFDEDDNVDAIADEMVTRRVNRVPILSGCKLAGIITRADILRAIATKKQ